MIDSDWMSLNFFPLHPIPASGTTRGEGGELLEKNGIFPLDFRLGLRYSSAPNTLIPSNSYVRSGGASGQGCSMGGVSTALT